MAPALRIALASLAAGTLFPSASAQTAGAADLSTLARDVDRAESVRAVKDLQRTYAQYVQFGLWHDMAALFTSGGLADFGDGPQIQGRDDAGVRA
jgi:hypothetical protein